MAFAVKDWKDSPDTSTPLSAAALENLESRLAAYTDAEDLLVTSRYGLLIPRRTIIVPAATGASTLFLPEGATAGLAAATTDSPASVVHFDPADFAMAGRTTKGRVRAALLTNGTAPGITFTVGLYPITASAGGAGAITMTAGTVQAGSTVAFATPSLSTQNQGNSGDFTLPAAGYYALGVVLSGSTAASSRVILSAELQVRAV